MPFLYIKNNIIIGSGFDKTLEKDVTNIAVGEELFEDRLEHIGKYIYKENQIVIDKEYAKQEEKRAQQEEKERISKLTCTKRVLALALQEYGLTYTKLKELIATNEQAQLEWDLCVELERSNPLLDIMGAELGITPKQLDNIFRLANGEVIDDSTTDTDTAIVPDEVQPEGN